MLAVGELIPPDLIGPSALAVGALIAVGALWREDRRIYRERIADLSGRLDVATAGWSAQTAANAKLVEQMAIERAARDAAK